MPVAEDRLAWLKEMMPHAKSAKEYGVSFAEDAQFSPMLTDDDSVRAAGLVLEIHGSRAAACFFGKVSPGTYQMHVVFEKAAAGPACELYRDMPVPLTREYVDQAKAAALKPPS